MKKFLLVIFILISVSAFAINADVVIEIYNPLGKTIEVEKYNFFEGKIYWNFNMSEGEEVGQYTFDGLLLKFNLGPSEFWAWKIKNRFAGSGIIRAKLWIPVTVEIKDMYLD